MCQAVHVHSITTVLFVSLWVTEWIVYWPHTLTIHNTFTYIHACTYTCLHTHTHDCSHAHTPQMYIHMQFRLGGESQIVSTNRYGVLWFKGKELNMVFGLLYLFCLPGIVRTPHIVMHMHVTSHYLSFDLAFEHEFTRIYVVVWQCCDVTLHYICNIIYTVYFWSSGFITTLGISSCFMTEALRIRTSRGRLLTSFCRMSLSFTVRMSTCKWFSFYRVLH